MAAGNRSAPRPPRIRNSKLPADGILKVSPQLRWNHSHREARRAHAIVRAAIKNGTLKRKPCAVCGSLRVDFHHPFGDYSNPCVGVFLCRLHHKAAHAAERETRRAA